MYACMNCGKEFSEKYELMWTYDCHGIPFHHVCCECYDDLMKKGYDGVYYTEADECIYEDY